MQTGHKSEELDTVSHSSSWTNRLLDAANGSTFRGCIPLRHFSMCWPSLPSAISTVTLWSWPKSRKNLITCSSKDLMKISQKHFVLLFLFFSSLLCLSVFTFSMESLCSLPIWCSSLCTKVVRHPVILDVFPEGHCFPGVHSPKETDWLMIFSCHRALTTEVDRAHKVQGNSFFTVSILQKQYLGSVWRQC